MYDNTTSEFFKLPPPTIYEYSTEEKFNKYIVKHQENNILGNLDKY